MIKTANQLKDQAIDIGLRNWDVHDCSMCGYKCGYVFSTDYQRVGYDTGCDCTNGGPNIETRSWENLAESYNMNQPENNPRISKKYLDEINEIWKWEDKK